MSLPFNIENIISRDELKLISSMTLNYQDGEDLLVFTPEMRSEQFNALILLEILHFQSTGGEDLTDDFLANSILNQCVVDINHLFDSFTLASLLYLQKNWSNLDKDRYKIFRNQYAAGSKLIAFYRAIAEGGSKNIIFAETISKYLLFTTSAEIAFDKNTAKYLKYEDKPLFYPGLSIGERFDLISPLSQTKTQIWKARDTVMKVNRALKFYPIEMFADADEMKAALKSGNVKKIRDAAASLNADFQNRNLLKMLGESTSGYLMLDYSMITRSIYMVMECYDGSLDKINVKSLGETIMSLLELLMKLHTSGFCFNNITPSHIVRKSSDSEDKDSKDRVRERHNESESEVFHLIDFKRVSPFLGNVIDYSTSGYTSLGLLSGNRALPYDDVESLLYIAEFLIGGQPLDFPSEIVERELKKTLEPFNDRIRNAIVRVRNLRQQDEYAVTGEHHPDTEEYIKLLYYGEGGFGAIFEEMFDGFEEVSNLAIVLHPSEEALAMRIKVDMASSHLFEALKTGHQVDEMALKIMNHIKFGVEYTASDQNLINRFLKAPI